MSLKSPLSLNLRVPLTGEDRGPTPSLEELSIYGGPRPTQADAHAHTTEKIVYN